MVNVDNSIHVEEWSAELQAIAAEMGEKVLREKMDSDDYSRWETVISLESLPLTANQMKKFAEFAATLEGDYRISGKGLIRENTLTARAHAVVNAEKWNRKYAADRAAEKAAKEAVAE